MEKIRCWRSLGHPLMIDYHDKERWVPLHDDKKLFEFIVLDSFQAGLSRMTIIKKRENFAQAFDNFDYKKIAKYTEKDFTRLMNNAWIVRNRLKIQATIINAQKFLEIQKQFWSLDTYIRQFTWWKTIINKRDELKQLPAKSPESDAMSKDLLKHGFKFVGSTICYAFMQAAWMINDHLITCHCYKNNLNS